MSGSDPDLTEQGLRRAKGLAIALHDIPLKAIYATPYKRTQATVAPTVQQHHLPMQIYDATQGNALIDKLQASPAGHYLIAGHSNTVPEMLQYLGIHSVPSMNETEYGDLFVVTWQNAQPVLTRHRFEPVSVE